MHRKRQQTWIAGMLLLMTMISLIYPAAAAEIPAHTDDFYVNDFSGVLSAEAREYILNTNLDLNRKTGAQVVVVTMKSLNGDNLEQFATDMFRTYGIGDREKNNGILLLVITGDRQLRIEVGYGLESVINDAKAGRILDEEVIPYLKKNQWQKGILSGFNAIMKEVAAASGVEVPVNDAAVNELPAVAPKTTAKEEPPFWKVWDYMMMIAMGISAIAGGVFGAVLPYKSRYGIAPYLILVSLGFGIAYNIFIGLTAFFACGLFTLIGWAVTGKIDGPSTPVRRSGHSSHSHHSRSSSGSSSHSSYSGGGGSSGGGGASRSF